MPRTSDPALRVLALDTSSAVTAVAVLAGERVVFEDATPSAERHAQLLLPRVAAGLAAAGLTLAEVDLFAVGLGPGSFTGVRVGLATAKGFALATGRPVRGVGSLAVLADRALAGGALAAPVLDAYKGEVFAALYVRGADGLAQEVLSPFHATPLLAAERLLAASRGAPMRVLGLGLQRHAAQLAPLLRHAERLDPSFDAPSAGWLARHAAAAYRAHGASDARSLVPEYVRGSDAQLPANPLRL